MAADGPQCVLMRSSNTFFGASKFAALHMSARGTELPIPNVSSSAAMEGKADQLCSHRVLRFVTLTRHGFAQRKAANHDNSSKSGRCS